MLPSLASIIPRAALAAALLLPAACGCPPLVEGYATPDTTLLAWQAHLCRDDAQGEYGCLAASFQRAMGGFENYHAARAALLEEEPATAWLLARSDLLEHVVARECDDEGGEALLRLGDGDERIDVSFERETWLVVHWADGRREAFNQEQPLSALLGAQPELARQWLTIMKPPLTPEQIRSVRALSVEPRWKISGLGGLDPTARPAAARIAP